MGFEPVRDNGGKINYADSSVSVIARRYVNYDEAQMKANGTLGDMTFEEFKAANGEVRQVAVDEEFIQLIANATGKYTFTYNPETTELTVGFEAEQ